MDRSVAISVNASWNIANFRMGLVRALQARGYRVIALAPRDGSSDQLEAQGVEFLEIEMDNQGLSPARDLVLLFRYWRTLRRLRPDFFLSYTAKPNVYGSLAAQALGIKVINNVSGLGTAFIKQGWLTHILSLLYRLAFRRSSTIFFQNEEDRRLFLSRGLLDESRARLLPGSGVDIEKFRPLPREDSPRERFTFLMVGRLLWDKGVGEFVEAARLLGTEAPDARFQVLGFLNVANRTAVPRAQVEAWMREGTIEYLGATEDVVPFLQAADCVVLPSYREGLPRSLLEAAAMAKPLIATDVPGCRQIVEAGVNGLLCRVRDARDLADAMLEMIRTPPEQRLAWGRAGRERIEREFDERIVATLYLQAMDDAAGESESARY